MLLYNQWPYYIAFILLHNFPEDLKIEIFLYLSVRDIFFLVKLCHQSISGLTLCVIYTTASSLIETYA